MVLYKFVYFVFVMLTLMAMKFALVFGVGILHSACMIEKGVI